MPLMATLLATDDDRFRQYWHTEFALPHEQLSPIHKKA